MSSLFNSLHHINLTEVKRQTNPFFIKAVNAAAIGCLDRGSEQLLRSLSEPLSVPLAKHLFSTNLEVEMFNCEWLNEMPGEWLVYKALDKG